MAIPEPNHTGTVDFNGWSTWYRITGEPGRTPLVVLHGGPGAGHDYTLRIAGIAEQGRPVIHYDQLGIGSPPTCPTRAPTSGPSSSSSTSWTTCSRTLGIADGYHLLGQSWGGMLAAEHAVRRPPGLRGLVIANSPASMELWLRGGAELRAALPRRGPAHPAGPRGGRDHRPPRLPGRRAGLQRAPCVPYGAQPAGGRRPLGTTSTADPTVYHTMNGPNEFHVVGTLKDWSVIDRLHLIEVPTLLVSGRYDEATPETVQPFADRIPDVRWHIFEHSSHMPHVEEEELYLRVVGDFLDSTD